MWYLLTILLGQQRVQEGFGKPTIGLVFGYHYAFCEQIQSSVPKSPHWGWVKRISNWNKLRYLTKGFFCCWDYFVTFRQRGMHLDRLAWFGLEIWPSNQRQEEEEWPGKGRGWNQMFALYFTPENSSRFIITHLVLQLRIKVALHQTLPQQPSWLESTPHLREPRRHEHNFKCKLNWGGSGENT